MEQRKCASALRVGRGEQRRHSAPLMRRENDCLLRSGGVEHSMQVLHPRLQCRELAAVIGQPGASLVEQDQPKRPRQAQVEVAPTWVLPRKDQVRHETRHVHEVGLAASKYLIGDRRAAIADVAGLRLHRRSVSRHRRTKQVTDGGGGRHPAWHHSPRNRPDTAGCQYPQRDSNPCCRLERAEA